MDAWTDLEVIHNFIDLSSTLMDDEGGENGIKRQIGMPKSQFTKNAFGMSFRLSHIFIQAGDMDSMSSGKKE